MPVATAVRLTVLDFMSQIDANPSLWSDDYVEAAKAHIQAAKLWAFAPDSVRSDLSVGVHHELQLHHLRMAETFMRLAVADSELRR